MPYSKTIIMPVVQTVHELLICQLNRLRKSLNTQVTKFWTQRVSKLCSNIASREDVFSWFGGSGRFDSLHSQTLPAKIRFDVDSRQKQWIWPANGPNFTDRKLTAGESKLIDRNEQTKFILLSHSTFAVITWDFLKIIGEIDSYLCWLKQGWVI